MRVKIKLTQRSTDQLLSSYLTPQNIALGVAYLRNSRAITCDTRLDSPLLYGLGLRRIYFAQS
jgi:hypothetical protein